MNASTKQAAKIAHSISDTAGSARQTTKRAARKQYKALIHPYVRQGRRQGVVMTLMLAGVLAAIAPRLSQRFRQWSGKPRTVTIPEAVSVPPTFTPFRQGDGSPVTAEHEAAR